MSLYTLKMYSLTFAPFFGDAVALRLTTLFSIDVTLSASQVTDGFGVGLTGVPSTTGFPQILMMAFLNVPSALKNTNASASSPRSAS